MKTMELIGGGLVRGGRTEIDVPHLGSKITHILPLIGPNYHHVVMKENDSRKLLRPTTAQALSLVDLALQNKENPHCDEILNRFRDNYLWTATENLSVPEGVLVYDNIDGKMPSTKDELMKLFEAGDSKVRFVESGFDTGWMTRNKGMDNPYTIAQIGKEMLGVYERVAKELHGSDVYVFGLNGTKQEEKRLSAVGGYCGWLVLGGNVHGGVRDGYASGVIRAGEASQKNKMAKQTKTQVYEIERPEPVVTPPTKITVPYQNETISFVHPFSKPNYYKDTMVEVLGNETAKPSLPNGEQITYLLHAVYCGPKDFQNQPELEEVRNKMRNNWFWIAQRNLWVPEKYDSAHGVFTIYDEKGVGLSQELDIGILEKSLKGGKRMRNGIKFSEDGKVGFAPRNTYKHGPMSPEDFAKDGFVIITAKKEGAKKLAKASSSEHFSLNPYSWILEPTNEPVQGLSAVDGDYSRLDLVGFHYDGRSGFASGVIK